MLSLLTFPDPRLKNKASKVDPCDPENKIIIEQLRAEIQQYRAYGMNAPMFGIAKSIVVLNPQASSPEENKSIPEVLLNPEIIAASGEMQKIEEGSPCFYGISAEVSRPAKITVRYQDVEGNSYEFDVEGFKATVIQHQMDHLMGKNFLDHLSPLKRNLLLKKMSQIAKHGDNHHVHGPNCHHD
ncbi:MAG: peptide deformylase [Janthinobacterium lividum]